MDWFDQFLDGTRAMMKEWDWPAIPLIRFFGAVTLDLRDAPTQTISSAHGMDGCVIVILVDPPSGSNASE